MAELNAQELSQVQRQLAVLSTGAARLPQAKPTQGPPQPSLIRGERGDSISDNFLADFDDLVEGYKTIGSMIAQDGFSAIVDIAKAMPGAIVDSYSRWYKAAKRGPEAFAELVRAHPLEFAQDALLPLTLAFGGAGGLIAAAGKGSARAAKVGRILNKAANVSNALEVVSDPIGGPVLALGTLGVRKGASAVFRKIVDKPPAPDFKMNIDVSEARKADGVRKSLDKLKTRVINEVHPIQKVFRELGDEDAAQRTQLFAVADQRGLEMFENGMHVFGTGTRTGNKGLREILVELGSANKNDFDDLLTARRSIELQERGIEHGQNLDKALEVINQHSTKKLEKLPSKQEFKELLASGSFDAGFTKALRGYDQFHRDLLDYGEGAGLYSREVKESIIESNEFYAPFLRAGFDGGEAGSRNVRGAKTPLQKIKGSERAVTSPTDSSQLLTLRMVREAELNQIVKALDGTADIEKSGVTRIGTPTGIAAHVSVNEALDALGSKQKLTGSTEDFSKPSAIFRGKKDLPDNVVTFLENGERKFLELDDPDLAQAFASLRMKRDTDLHNIFMPFRGVAKFQRLGVTRAPGFPVMNAARDQVMAWIQSNYGFIPGWDTARGLMDYMGKTQFYDDMRGASMMQATLQSFDRKTLNKTLTESVKSGEPGHWKEVARNLVTDPVFLLKGAFRGLQEFADISEQSTRLGAARRAFETETRGGTGRGLALQRAAFEGREVTTDFARRGASDVMKAVNAITAFQNPRLQGIDRLARAFKQNPVRTTTRAATAITIPSMLLYMHNLNDPEYAEIPQIEKDLFWHFRIGDRLWRAPKPFEAGLVFGSLTERMMALYFEENPESISGILARIGSEFQPFDLPTAIKPVVEIGFNRSFYFDTPIEGRGAQRLSKSERANSGTTELARILSDWSSVLGGSATSGVPRQAALSPVQIDHLVFGVTGTLGREVLRTVDRGVSAAGLGTGVEPPQPKGGTLGKIPIVNRLLSNVSKRSQARSDFFEINEVLGQKLATFKNLTGKSKREFLDQNRRDITDAKIIQKFSRAIFKMMKVQRLIRNSTTATPQQKRQRIDAIDRRINRLAQRALEVRRS